MFSDVLLTVDYDRTLTAPNSTIPERNLEAIRYFIANGGAFTVNTGRSLPMAGTILKNVPYNAPLLLYNGSAAYNTEKGELMNIHPIPADAKETMDKVLALFPDLLIEVQATDAHYSFRRDADWEAFTNNNRCPLHYISTDRIPQPFLKYTVYLKPSNNKVETLFSATPEEIARMDQVEQTLIDLFGEKMEVFRVGAKMVDVHAKGVSKNRAARELQAVLGRKILVCVGDAPNDLSMLEGADYSFCPADAALAERFPNVCPCAEGAVADVIYEKIPEILGIKP